MHISWHEIHVLSTLQLCQHGRTQEHYTQCLMYYFVPCFKTKYNSLFLAKKEPHPLNLCRLFTRSLIINPITLYFICYSSFCKFINKNIMCCSHVHNKTIYHWSWLFFLFPSQNCVGNLSTVINSVFI